MQTTAIIIASLFFILGFVGTLIPALPGPLFILIGMLIYGFMTEFAELSVHFFLLQAFAVILVFAVDYLAAGIGSRSFGGSKHAFWGAIAGLFIGLIVLGFFGIIIGPFAGAFLGELLHGKPADKALRSSFGTLAGLMGGLFIKFFIEIVMIFWFFYSILR